MTVSIKKAVYLKDYKIRVLFSDGMEQIVDFGRFLSTAKNPMTRKYLDLHLFKNFQIKYGDLEWNNYELCFPVRDLHQGKISHLTNPSGFTAALCRRWRHPAIGGGGRRQSR